MLDALPAPPSEVIVVTGKALTDPAAGHVYQIDDLKAQDLRDSPSHSLDQILKQVAGLQLFRRSDSTSGHPTSHGVTLRALGGNASSRALLILDGVPQTDPFGGWVNWPAYDPAGLGRVQIVRGGGSVANGSGALAGTIDMESLGTPGLNATIEGGSRQSIRAHLYEGATFGGSLLTIDAQGGRSEGFIPVTSATRGPADRRAPYEEASLRVRWTTPVSANIEAQLSGLAFADVRDRGLDFTRNRTRGGDASIRLVGRGEWEWSALAYTQARNLRSSFASVNEDRSVATRVSLQDSVPSWSLGFGGEVRPPAIAGFAFRFGADSRFTKGESRELYSFVDGDPTRRRIAGGQSIAQGVFAEASTKRGPVELSAGVRIDHWQIDHGRLLERLLATGTTARNDMYGDRSGWLPTMRGGAVIDLLKGTSFRLSAYRGWRLPTLNELFRPFRAGADATAANPALDPETLSGAEAGLRLNRGPVELSLTGFVNRLEDAIANVTLGRGPGTFPGVGFVAGDYRQRRNIDAVKVRGLEASGSVRRGPWSAKVGASLTDARVQADGLAAALDGLRPAQTPRYVFSAEAGWDHGGRAISVELRRVSSQFEDDLNAQKLKPATTVDAFGRWPLSRRIGLVVRVTNLLDKDVDAGIGDDGAIERATPRTVWLGFRLVR